MKAENSSPSIINRRVYAFNIDLFLIFLTNHFLQMAFKQFLTQFFFYFPTKLQMMFVTRLGPVYFLSMSLLTFSYFTLFYFVTNGHTFGKSLMGLRVYNHDHSEISLKQAMWRAFAYIICAMTGSFLFALSYIRKDEKSLADVLSQTHVDCETRRETLVEKLSDETSNVIPIDIGIEKKSIDNNSDKTNNEVDKKAA